MRYAFYFDQSKCMSCNACSVACKDWNQVNPGPVRWRNVDTFEKDINGAMQYFNLAMSCNHCETPACKAACTIGAIKKRDDGVVFVDKTKCQGLQLCIKACPFAATHIAGNKQEPEKKSGWVISHPMQKCDMCRERIDKGQKPACVAGCPAHALDFGDYDLLKYKYPESVVLNASEFPYAYRNNTDQTGPSMLIKKRGALTVIKAK